MTPLNPLIKNARLIQQTGRVSASCTRPNHSAPAPLPSKKGGSGRPAMWPMVTYINGTRKHRLAISRRFSRGVSVSSSAASPASGVSAAGDAP